MEPLLTSVLGVGVGTAKSAGTGVLTAAAKSAVQHWLGQSAAEKATDATAEQFPDLEGLADALREWRQTDQFADLLATILAGKREIVDEIAVDAFVERTSFFNAVETFATARDVLTTFFERLAAAAYAEAQGLAVFADRVETQHRENREQFDLIQANLRQLREQLILRDDGECSNAVIECLRLTKERHGQSDIPIDLADEEFWPFSIDPQSAAYGLCMLLSGRFGNLPQSVARSAPPNPWVLLPVSWKQIVAGALRGSDQSKSLAAQYNILCEVAWGVFRRSYAKLFYTATDRRLSIHQPIVMPEMLLHYDESWFLVARCHQRKRRMVFGLDTVEHVAFAAGI